MNLEVLWNQLSILAILMVFNFFLMVNLADKSKRQFELSEAGKSLYRGWTKPGQRLDKAYTEAGKSLDRGWTKPEQRLDRAWTQAGQSLDRTWTEPGQSLDRGWSDAGQRLEKAMNKSRLIPGFQINILGYSSDFPAYCPGIIPGLPG